MKTLTLSLLLLAALAYSAYGQAVLQPAALMPNKVESGGLVLPTTIATVETSNFRVVQLTVYNRSGATGTVSVCDRQAVPKCILSSVTNIANGEHVVVSFPAGWLMKSGMTWLASADGFEASLVAMKP